MSNIPISSLPIALSLTGSEAVPMVQAGTTKSATVSLINAANIANIPIGGLTGQGLIKQSNNNYDTKWATVAGFGTVQEVDTGTGLTGGPITVTGTISLAPITSHTLLANITGGSAAPIPNTPSSVLDIIGATQGDLLYRDTAGWLPLAPGSNGQILTSQGSAANPKWSAVGSGTVQSVGLSLPGIFTVTNSPVTTTGTLTGALNTQNANLVWGGPSTGAAATPTFRSLVGADLPNPSASALGGIQSFAGTGSQWIRSISTSGVPASSQPAFTDISGVTTGAQLPNPSATTLGGIQSLVAVTSKWINTISTSGIPSATQPAFSDISGGASLGQLPSIGNNSILSNISGGSATPLANSLTSIIDASIASTQGDVLYRNASTWVALPPGTAGQVLSTGGAAANPSWTTVSGTGTVTSVATNNGLTGGPVTSSGTIGLATIATGNVLAYTGAGSGVPVATIPSTILDVIGSTEGNVLYRGVSAWAVLAPGTSGQFLQTPGAGSTPSWASALTTAGTGLTVSGGNTIAISAARQTLPTVQSFTSGTSATYTRPANCLWIEVFMSGGGGGGGGAPSGSGVTVAGSDGTASAFNSISALQGRGASASTAATGVAAGGAGGTGGLGTATRRMPGTPGTSGANSSTAVIIPPSAGGSSVLFGGGGAPVVPSAGVGVGISGAANSGGGGSGAINFTSVDNNSAAAGGGAESVYLLINSPSATYTYTVGTGGAGGTSTTNGGAGGSGFIQVIEHYGS